MTVGISRGSLVRLFQFSLIVVAMLVLSACDRKPTAPTQDSLNFGEIILEDQGSSNTYIYSHNDHWHGVLRTRPGMNKDFKIYFVPPGQMPSDHSLPARNVWFDLTGKSEYSVRVTIEDGGVASWQGNALNGTLRGTTVGGTHATFVVLRGQTTVYQSPPLGLSIAN